MIPRKTGLLGERSHGLDQLVDLCAKQDLSIACLNRLNVIRPSELPIFYRILICRAVNGKPEVIRLAAKDEIKGIDGRLK